ncbi:MAG TPA: hypothetical protein VN042_13815 [Asticcacaulis sp.]|nr:hypothetical protein [Asticcacaulis sp.]
MNSDFDDAFGGPPDGFAPYHAGPDPLLIMLLIVLGLVVAGFVGLIVYLGRQRGLKRLRAERAASAEAIYASIRHHLDKALASPGGVMLERGREVADIIEARLGFVLALKARPGRLIGELDKALAGKIETPSGEPGPVKVKRPLPTETHYLEVWKALQGLNQLWEDRPRVLAMIEAAQAELSERPPLLRSKPVVVEAAATVAAALADADRGVIAPEPEPDPPEPTPPKPRARREKRAKESSGKEGGKEGGEGGGGKRKDDLPPHKRNMLA